MNTQGSDREYILPRIERNIAEIGLDKLLVPITSHLFNENPRKLRYAYLYTETQDNQGSVFGGALEIRQQGLAEELLIMDTTARSGYIGYAAWHEELAKLLKNVKIKGIPYHGPESLNTLTESEEIVRFCVEQSIDEIYIVAPTFHLLRAFMTLVSVILKKKEKLKVYCYPGTNLDWEEEVFHSQGILRARRKEFITSELERIKTYQAKGDILPSEKISDYLVSRDKA
jgi:hypothetical protein